MYYKNNGHTTPLWKSVWSSTIYYACGEQRDGYNVFSTEQECTKTCVPQGIVYNVFIQAEATLA